MTNAFSPTWCDLFLDAVPRDQTLREVAFIRRQMPLPDFGRVLDVACGTGRHCAELSNGGYDVVGVDRAPELVARAEASGCPARFQVLDMLHLEQVDGVFDGASSLWHSFGFFDAAGNQAVLRQLHAKLRPRGRLILDVYNRDHAERLPPVEVAQRRGVRVETRRSWRGPRWRVDLFYDGVLTDQFEWQLYSPEELAALCGAQGFSLLLSCAWFDEPIAASPEHARMQLVLERNER